MNTRHCLAKPHLYIILSSSGPSLSPSLFGCAAFIDHFTHRSSSSSPNDLTRAINHA